MQLFDPTYSLRKTVVIDIDEFNSLLKQHPMSDFIEDVTDPRVTSLYCILLSLHGNYLDFHHYFSVIIESNEEIFSGYINTYIHHGNIINEVLRDYFGFFVSTFRTYIRQKLPHIDHEVVLFKSVRDASTMILEVLGN